MVRSIFWHNLKGSPIIVTENVVEYRKAIDEFLEPSDTVLEVGCAEGLTTALIAQKCTQAFGIDKSESQAAKAVQRHQHIANLVFRQIDAWDLAAVLKMAGECSVPQISVVFIDVSGSRKVGDVDELVTKYEQVFGPRLFVVKCYLLKRLMTRCRLYTPVQGKQQQQQKQGQQCQQQGEQEQQQLGEQGEQERQAEMQNHEVKATLHFRKLSTAAASEQALPAGSQPEETGSAFNT